MIIAHLADLHLGYRAYNRTGPAGENLREADVIAAFDEAIEAVARLAPQLVIVAGDVFHTVRPSNAAIAAGFRRFSSLAARLAGVPIVIVAGERDTPRSSDTATILDLFGEIEGVHVVTDGARRIRLEEIDTSVLALPHAALTRREPPIIEPDPRSALNVLALHGSLLGAVEDRITGAVGIPEAAITFRDWAYVALGHLPNVTEIAPNAWYAGSLERTSGSVWAEAGVEKGFLSFEAGVGATFHPVSTREVVDLPRISARGLSAQELDDSVARAVAEIPGGIEGKIVRLVITEMPRERMRELDHRRLREYRGSALHFQIDPRPPEKEVAGMLTRPVRGQTLESLVEDYLAHAWTPTMEGIDRSRLATLASAYLARTRDDGES